MDLISLIEITLGKLIKNLYICLTLIHETNYTAAEYSHPMMSLRISDIEGIGPKLCIKLEKAGITTIEHLIKECSGQKGRQDICLKTGISEEKLLKWVNMIDLFRIDGLGVEYSELLEASGVEAIKELRSVDPEKLHEKMLKVNSTKKFVLQVPSLQEIQQFVTCAKILEPVVLN